MPSLENRLKALEAPPDRDGKPLPTVVDDSTSDVELERLRRGSREVYRFSEFLEAVIW